MRPEEVLPHRPPFLLLDSIDEVVPGHSAGVRRGAALRARRPLTADPPGWAQSSGGARTRQPLWPPKPNELEITGPGCQGRGAPRTRSRPMAGSGVVTPKVGGIRARWMLSTTAAASRAPAAPKAWPVTPLVEVTGGPGEPNSLRMASASAASLRGVEVPWALIWPMSAGPTAASARASSMQAAAPAPAGAGAVRWWASAVLAAPRTSARTLAPPLRALAISPSTRTAPPSDSTKPSPLTSNGRDTPVGDTAVMLPKRAT